MRNRKLLYAVMVGVALVSMSAALALAQPGKGKCQDLPSESELKAHLMAAPAAGGDAGGLFHGTRMWGAVVNRDGEVCAYTTSTADPAQVWPGSQAIAKSKAYTANAFSLDDLALSTARLYTFTQPGHSLWSLGQSICSSRGSWHRRQVREAARTRSSGD